MADTQKIERLFSDWLIERVKADTARVLRQGGLTVDAMSWIQGSNMKAIESGLMQGTPASLLLTDAFLAGVNYGFMFREHLAQMEELPL